MTAAAASFVLPHDEKLILASGVSMFLALAAAQTPRFQPGQLAVLRAGDGKLGLKLKQAPIFVDQFDPSILNASPSLSVAIPTNGLNALFFNGQAATEGNLTRSDDRTALSFAGYGGANLLAQSGAPSGLSINRGFCAIDAFTNYVLVYNGSNWYAGTNPRGVAGDGTNNFWGAGGAVGTMCFNPATTAAPLGLETLPSTRAVKVIHGVVYTTLNGADSFKGYPAGIYNFVDSVNNPVPLPETAASYLNLLVPAQAPFTNNVGFDMNAAGTIAYMADTEGGIQKHVKAGGLWQFAYNFSIPQNIPASLNNGAGCFGIAVDFSGPAPVIYATTVEGFGGNMNSNRVVRVVDTNASTSVNTIVQAKSVQVAYRGIDFTPDLEPLITSAPASQSVVAGSSVTFSVSASSLYPVSYQWLQNGTVLAGQAGATLNLSGLALAANGNTYQCAVSNRYGAVTSAPPALLSVGSAAAAPAISGPSQNISRAAGDLVVITASATGTPPLSYLWYFNGTRLGDANEYSGTASNALAISDAQVSDSGAYSVVVTNAAGAASNLVASLSVVYPPPVIISQPASTVTFVGGPAVFNVTGPGTPLSYQWYARGSAASLTALSDTGEFSGSQTATLTITGAGFADATNGGYFAVITDPGGSVTSAPAALSVLAFPPHSFVAYTNAGQIYTQNFDSLPIPDGSTFNTANPATITELTNIALGEAGTLTYSLDNPFDFAFPVVPPGSQGGLGLGSTMPGWYGWAGTETKLGASAGDQTTGGDISFGKAYTGAAANNVTNRALGLLATSTTGPTAMAVKLVNQTGAQLSSINLSYIGELWRQQTSAQVLAFGYTVDNTAAKLFSTNVTASVPGLNVGFSVSASGSQALDGTQPGNQISLGVTNLFIGDWAPGGALWLVWVANDFQGGAQGLAIDNLRFSASVAQPVILPVLSVQAGAGGLTLSWPAGSPSFTLQQSSNLTQPGGWSAAPEGVSAVSGVNTVTVPLPSAGAILFFRLVH
jgi:hypothetical protein